MTAGETPAGRGALTLLAATTLIGVVLGLTFGAARGLYTGSGNAVLIGALVGFGTGLSVGVLVWLAYKLDLGDL